MSRKIPGCFQGEDGEAYLRRLEYQFDLDCGGYELELVPCDREFEGVTAVQIEISGGEIDYLGLADSLLRKQHEYDNLVYMFAPNTGHFPRTEWPKSYKHDDEETLMRLVAQGDESPRDHECSCHGRFVPWTGAAGEPPEPVPADKLLNLFREHERGAEYMPKEEAPDGYFWKFTGDSSGLPYPWCERCDGDGYVDAVGGEWAMYASCQRVVVRASFELHLEPGLGWTRYGGEVGVYSGEVMEREKGILGLLSTDEILATDLNLEDWEEA